MFGSMHFYLRLQYSTKRYILFYFYQFISIENRFVRFERYIRDGIRISFHFFLTNLDKRTEDELIKHD